MRAADLAQRVEELSAAAERATEVEMLRAQVVELDRSLTTAKEEHARSVMKATLAETHATELTNQVNDCVQRVSSAEWELEKARSEMEAARRRSQSLETELARMMKRVAELDRRLVVTRGQSEAAENELVALRSEIEGARSSVETTRAELERTTAARTLLESELRARLDGTSAARGLLAELELEEQRLGEKRRRALAEVREVLGRGEAAATTARSSVPPTPSLVPVASVTPPPPVPVSASLPPAAGAARIEPIRVIGAPAMPAATATATANPMVRSERPALTGPLGRLGRRDTMIGQKATPAPTVTTPTDDPTNRAK